MFTWTALIPPGRPAVMGIVNATPDSFSDGGRALGAEAALAQARRLADDGADLIDVGGESSRPGAVEVPAVEELRRVVPAVEAIVGALALPVSVDTTKAAVARAAIAAGAAIVNDVTALRGDPDLGRVVADTGVGLVLMHMIGTPQTMQDDPRYVDVVAEVYEFLARRVEAAEALGIGRDRIAVDPGLGFGKTFDHNLALLRGLDRFAGLGCPVLVGASRKGFLGRLTGRPVDRRAAATAGASVASATLGAAIVRVHDVAETVDVLKVWAAILGPSA